jgi:hypothetical protein
MRTTHIMWEKAVGEPGVGRVERSIVHRIIILSQVNGTRRQKIITTRFVVRRRLGLRKRSIVGEGIRVIVHGGGKNTSLE